MAVLDLVFKNEGEDGAIPINATALNTIVNALYPVGSIYMSMNSTSPQTLFGGTWESIEGRFLIGVGTATDINGDTRTLVEGQTGGEYAHTLTIDEMPQHKHTARVEWNLSGASTTNTLGVGSTAITATNLSGNLSVDNGDNQNIGLTGGSLPHNTTPPYQAVYMWKRTA